MKKIVYVIALATSFSPYVMADLDVISNYVETPQKVGEARFSFLFWDVYDAALYTAKASEDLTPPFALELTYLRDLDGDAIAERSIEEMRKQGADDDDKLNRWERQMKAMFPDVSEEQIITGIADNNSISHFYFNAEKIGVIDDPEFTQRFFDIWLGKNTSEPKFRAKLLKGISQ